MEIHRRNYHLPAGPLKRALQLGNFDKAVIDLVDETLAQCASCRDYLPLPTRQNASLEIETEVNHTVWSDLWFWHAGVEDWKEITLLKILDDASRFTQNNQSLSRTTQHLREAMLLWVVLFGFPKFWKWDRESGVDSEAMRV